jgi:hypothetical protein
MQVGLNINILENKAKVSIGTDGSAFHVTFSLPHGWMQTGTERNLVADISPEDREKILKALKTEGKRQKKRFMKTQAALHQAAVRRGRGRGHGSVREVKSGSGRPSIASKESTVVAIGSTVAVGSDSQSTATAANPAMAPSPTMTAPVPVRPVFEGI